MRNPVIYYGWLIDANKNLTEPANRIVNSKADMLVASFIKSDGSKNISQDFLNFAMKKNPEMEILAYIYTHWRERSLAKVMEDINKIASSGIDGVFIDEATSMNRQSDYIYYKKLTDYAFSKNLHVILNPGMWEVDQRIMDLCDILCFEHQWLESRYLDWKPRYEPDRFMGITTAQSHGEISYSNCIELTQKSLSTDSYIGCHYAANNLTDIDPWYQDYMNYKKLIKQQSFISNV